MLSVHVQKSMVLRLIIFNSLTHVFLSLGLNISFNTIDFCTCTDSSAVGACAKFMVIWFLYMKVQKNYFTNFAKEICGFSVEWVHGTRLTKFLLHIFIYVWFFYRIFFPMSTGFYYHKILQTDIFRLKLVWSAFYMYKVTCSLSQTSFQCQGPQQCHEI